MSSDWTNAIAAERMKVDTEFNDRVEASSFSNQQWNLVMTALEFEIEGAEDPETAEIVADTSNLSTIMPELDRIAKQGPMGGGGGGGGGGGSSGDTGGGLLGGVKDALGLGGGGGGDDRIEEAEELAAEYAGLLQEKLETNGRWSMVCDRAA
ncbi:DUF5799 family protein [Halomicrobium sp. LC1Hm]|uniref:DUF5799 family protein n=1 Tax=Halomicrobium sp. LC1Hm TaxID=2610902 RepID=UPI0012984C7B|nr:DUF5799 family protein [Halomicrobium sp. LC1Hm]QGA83049.1 Uncharacterized protein LC1Hm_2012 [Halomicrobium sp. LC1Hm]